MKSTIVDSIAFPGEHYAIDSLEDRYKLCDIQTQSCSYITVSEWKSKFEDLFRMKCALKNDHYVNPTRPLPQVPKVIIRKI